MSTSEHTSLGAYRPEIDAYYNVVVALGHKSTFAMDLVLEARDDHIGRGTEYCAFSLADPTKVGKVLLGRWVSEGIDRTTNPTDTPGYDVVINNHQQKILAYERALGANRLEQLVAADATHPQGLVTEYIAGNRLDGYLNAGKVFAPQEFTTLFTAYEAMHERDLIDDPDAGNIMYSQRTGFSVIDYTLRKNSQRTLLDSVVEFTDTAQLLQGIETEMTSNIVPNGISYQRAVRRRYGQAAVERIQASWQYRGTGLQRLLDASAKYL